MGDKILMLITFFKKKSRQITNIQLEYWHLADNNAKIIIYKMITYWRNNEWQLFQQNLLKNYVKNWRGYDGL